MLRHFEPLTLAELAQRSAMTPDQRMLIETLALPGVVGIDPLKLAHADAELYRQVRWSAHCANMFFELMDRIELQLFFPVGEPVVTH